MLSYGVMQIYSKVSFHWCSSWYLIVFYSSLQLSSHCSFLFFSFFLACRKFLNNKMLLVKRNDINKGKTLLSWGWGWGRTWLTSHIHKLAPATIATAVGPVARNFLPHLVDWHLMVSWCGSWGCFATCGPLLPAAQNIKRASNAQWPTSWKFLHQYGDSIDLSLPTTPSSLPNLPLFAAVIRLAKCGWGLQISALPTATVRVGPKGRLQVKWH